MAGGEAVADQVTAGTGVNELRLRGKTANDLHLCIRRARGAREGARCASEGGPVEAAKGRGGRHCGWSGWAVKFG
jgi:hypothetical protein